MKKNNLDGREDDESLFIDEIEDLNVDGEEKGDVQKLKELREKLKAKTEEARVNLEGWQRARAELVNKDRQIEKERIEIYKQAGAKIITDMLPVIDSYTIAKKNKEAWEKVDSNWRVGIEYIFSQLTNVLENAGLQMVTPNIGEAFDPNSMHGMGDVETEEDSKDHTVAEIISSGYSLNGKLLKEANVKVFIKK